MAAPVSPSYVAVQPNSTGEAIDTVGVDYQPLSAAVIPVFRQIVGIGDPNSALNVGTVTAQGELRIYDAQVRDLMAQLVVQMQITNALLNQQISPTSQQQNLTLLAAAFLQQLNLPN